MRVLLLFLFWSVVKAYAQTLPTDRSVDWTLAGLRDTTTSGFVEFDLQSFGIVGDSVTPNDSVFSHVLTSITGPGAILTFPQGQFLFNSQLTIPNNIVVRGQGVTNTTLVMDLGGSGSAINMEGSYSMSDTSSLSQDGAKDSNFVYVLDTSIFSVGDWVQIIQRDTDLITSTWAYNSVGQIVRIQSLDSNKLILESPLRSNFDLQRSPFIRKITPIENVGFECFKIKRIDDTSPQQSSSFHFNTAVNCWIMGVESHNCTFSHVQAQRSSNISVSRSYFHHAFSYGGGGRAYGVLLETTTNECLIEDNIFEHLRHAMIVQSGANGNVFAYNYSLDPFWDIIPSDAAGDVVLHGNYPFANLFEQNICQNIVIDNSHGPNGLHNTFFRNRAEGFGIFFSATNSPGQNFIGNDIPNTTFPYSIANYTIQGTGHFIHGNNNKGTIDPIGTQSLPDLSYAYPQRPHFIPSSQWAAIGIPNIMGTGATPSFERYQSGNLFSSSCGSISVDISSIDVPADIHVYPNPTNSYLIIESSSPIKRIRVIDLGGKEVFFLSDASALNIIDTNKWKKGLYFVTITHSNGSTTTRKVLKAN